MRVKHTDIIAAPAGTYSLINNTVYVHYIRLFHLDTFEQEK